MTEFDQQRVAKWIRDAFAILCVRVAGGSPAEKQLRLGFEVLLRQIGTPPLRIIARSMPPPVRPVGASSADLRQIIHALDSCLAVFRRYDAVLTPAQRRIDELLHTTRQFAEAELRTRQLRGASIAPFPHPAPCRKLLENSRAG